MSGPPVLLIAAAMFGAYWSIARRRAAACGCQLRVWSFAFAASAAALLAVCCVARTGDVTPWPLLLAVPGLAVCAVTDHQSGYVFDAVLLAMLAALAPACIVAHVAQHALGSGAGLAILGVPYAATRGRSVGFGDVKLAAVAGLALGYPRVLAALWIAFVAGGLAGASLLLARRARPSTRVPFAPFLAGGACAAAIWFPA